MSSSTLKQWLLWAFMCCGAGSVLGADKQIIEPECDLGAYHPPAAFAKDAEYAPGEVAIPKGNAALTDPVLVDTHLTRLACLDGLEDCIYRYPSECGAPADVAARLTEDIFACRAATAPHHNPVTVGQVLPNALLKSMVLDGVAVPISPGAGEDELFDEQFDLRQMGAENAWLPAEQLGLTKFVTAVIDNGIELEHVDLKHQLEPGVDIPCMTAACNGGAPYGSHGTAMGGVIAAEKHNSGTIGVAWNTRLLPIKIARSDTRFVEAAAIVATRCAVHRGAKVVNLSLGGDAPTPWLAQSLTTSTDDFLFVVPAGNYGKDLRVKPVYPASYSVPRMLVVLSHAPNGERESASGWGSNVDIAAPGQAMYPVPRKVDCGLKCYEKTSSNSSTAAAYVSGAAALLWSMNPTWKFADIKWRILETADYDDQLEDDMAHPRRLNLETMMFPISFKQSTQRTIRKTKLSDIDMTKAFPPTMCKPGKPVLVRPGDPPSKQLSPKDLVANTPVQIVATCIGKDGSESIARSLEYKIVN